MPEVVPCLPPGPLAQASKDPFHVIRQNADTKTTIAFVTRDGRFMLHLYLGLINLYEHNHFSASRVIVVIAVAGPWRHCHRHLFPIQLDAVSQKRIHGGYELRGHHTQFALRLKN